MASTTMRPSYSTPIAAVKAMLTALGWSIQYGRGGRAWKVVKDAEGAPIWTGQDDFRYVYRVVRMKYERITGETAPKVTSK